MKSTKKLTQELMETIHTNNERISEILCLFLDSVTDEDCNPIPQKLTVGMIQKLKDLNYEIFMQSENIEFAELDIIGQIEHNKTK